MDQVRERGLFDLIKACTQPVLGHLLRDATAGRRSEEQRRRFAGHHRRRRAENDRLWSAAIAYGLEPRLPPGGQPPVSRGLKTARTLLCSQLRNAGQSVDHRPV